MSKKQIISANYEMSHPNILVKKKMSKSKLFLQIMNQVNMQTLAAVVRVPWACFAGPSSK
jgi:hypothetical protein